MYLAEYLAAYLWWNISGGISGGIYVSGGISGCIPLVEYIWRDIWWNICMWRNNWLPIPLVEYIWPLAEYLGLYLWRNADGVPGNGGPPDHEVGVGRYPQDAPNKGDRKEFPR